jgi:hypothetical protein
LLSCTLTALAAERYRLANNRWPTSLDELCPRFLAEIPLDPYDGKPLRLAARDDGIVIYTIGPDGKDDGGKIINRAVRDATNPDLGLQLWHPAQRRIPPDNAKSPGKP